MELYHFWILYYLQSLIKMLASLLEFKYRLEAIRNVF